MGMTRETLGRKKAIRDEHFVPADDAQAIALKQAEQAHGLARFSGDAEKVEEARLALEAVRDEVRETGISFVIVAMGRKEFEALLREHPPTDEQRAENQATFNPDTFYPALFSESVEGDLTPEQWSEDFFDSPEWGTGEIAALRAKVMGVNTRNRVADLGN